MDRTAFLALTMTLVSVFAGCLSDNETATEGPETPDRFDADAHAIVQVPGMAPAEATGFEGILRDLDHGSAEPTLGVTEDGTILYAALGGTPDILRTTDGGLTWEDVSPMVAGQRTHPTSFDPMVYIDPGTGRAFDIDQQGGVTCYQLSYSDDLGDSWSGPFAACNKPVVDHQTIVAATPRTLVTAGYDNIVYVCYNIVAAPECIRSLNGGISFAATTPIQSPGAGAEGLNDLCSSLTGHLAAAADGTIYLPRRACDEVYVIISRDDGTSWEIVTVGQGMPSLGGTGISGPDPAVAVDRDGNVYYLYIGIDGQAYLQASTDAGRTWSDPVNVTRAGVTATNLPKIVAGDAGRVAITYYGTNRTGGYGASSETVAASTWNIYLGVITDALNATPTVTTARLNPADDPMVRGECGPGRCAGRILDFIDIEIDGEGRPWLSVTDSCVGECATPGGSSSQSNAGAGLLGTLSRGPSLYADVGMLTPLGP